MKSEKEKIVYACMTADIIHHGHINILENARKYGKVIVGLLTDEAVASYKRIPYLRYEEREKIVSNLKGVYKVIPQKTLDFTENLEKIKPDYVINGDDWKEGIEKPIREKVINQIKEWGGILIEIPYTKGVSGINLDEMIKKIGTTPEVRMKRLRRLLELKPIIRFMEASNGLSGLIVEQTKIMSKEKIKEFDGMWISSLCDSTFKGKPDIELIDNTSRLNTVNEILEVTTKPIILDGDTGGPVEHFVHNVKTFERLGISAVIIEDKKGLKKNSLLGTEVEQTQETIEDFSKKISEGKKALITSDFMIIARIESLILKKGINDAILRAKAYIEAGADGIMIHSKEKTPTEIFEFCERYKKFDKKVPLVVVPSTYSMVTEDELKEKGVNIVIYANHLIRSAYPAMKRTAEKILENERAKEVEEYCMSIKEILELIPGGK